MCGRFTNRTKAEEIKQDFNIAEFIFSITFFSRVTIFAPTQIISVVVELGGVDRLIALLKWGLIPSWAKDGYCNRMINARAETLAENLRSARLFADAVHYSDFGFLRMGEKIERSETAVLFLFERQRSFRICRTLGRMDRQRIRRNDGNLHDYHDRSERSFKTRSRPNAGDSGNERLRSLARCERNRYYRVAKDSPRLSRIGNGFARHQSSGQYSNCPLLSSILNSK